MLLLSSLLNDDGSVPALAYEEMMAQLLAAQALALAAYERTEIRDAATARAIVERVAGDPAVTARRRREGGGSVGWRATQRLCLLVSVEFAEAA